MSRPNPKAVFERFAAAAEQGTHDRLARLAGEADHYDQLHSKQSQLRQATAFLRVSKASRLAGRFDTDAWKAAVADLRDDGEPDWVFFMQNPGRRFRVRPWRNEDGEPASYRSPCVTIRDVENPRRNLVGVPIAGLHCFGILDKVVNTDAHAALWFRHAMPRTPV